MQTDTLTIEKSSRDFFNRRINRSIKKFDIQTSEDTTAYLVNLLQGFVHYSNMEDLRSEGRRGTKPLATIYAEALDAETTVERNCRLKRLGDFSLFTAGVFPKSLERQAVDVDYYAAMGANAYGYLSQTGKIQSNWHNLQTIFSDLSAGFVGFVDVIAEAVSNPRQEADSDSLRDYEIWVKTGSERARRKLLDAGVVPVFSGGASNRH